MRHSDWENRLSALIEEYRHKPFAWGECDCLRFANDAHWAVAGHGFADDWDAVPRSSASEAVRAVGGMDVVHAIDERLTRGEGYPPRGSIVAVSSRPGMPFSLGVAIGSTAAFVDMDGLGFIPIDAHLIWWAV